MNQATKVMLAIGAASALAIGASQWVSAQSPALGGEAIEDDRADAAEEVDREPAEAAELQRNATVTLLQAVQTAEQSASAAALSAELEREDGKIIYAVQVGDQEVSIDAISGQVVATEAESDRSIALQPLATITLQQAVQAAQTSANGEAYEAELEAENGGLIYAIEIGSQEIVVDAGNGRVLYTEVEGQESEQAAADRPQSSIQISPARR